MRSLLFATVVAALPLPLPTQASAPVSGKISGAVRAKLPAYDPTAHAAAERERRAAEERAAEREAPPAPAPAPAPAQTPVPPADPTVVHLAPFPVQRPRMQPAPLRLPRMEVAPAAHPEVKTDDPMLSPAERRRRLRKKHGSALNSLVLNPRKLFGAYLEEQAEARENYAAQLGELAGKMNLANAAGATPEELAELRELYLQLYLARPK